MLSVDTILGQQGSRKYFSCRLDFKKTNVSMN